MKFFSMTQWTELGYFYRRVTNLTQKRGILQLKLRITFQINIYTTRRRIQAPR